VQPLFEVVEQPDHIFALVEIGALQEQTRLAPVFWRQLYYQRV